MAVLAPMPSASVRTATAVKPGRAASSRTPWARSRPKAESRRNRPAAGSGTGGTVRRRRVARAARIERRTVGQLGLDGRQRLLVVLSRRRARIGTLLGVLRDFLDDVGVDVRRAEAGATSVRQNAAGVERVSSGMTDPCHAREREDELFPPRAVAGELRRPVGGDAIEAAAALPGLLDPAARIRPRRSRR